MKKLIVHSEEHTNQDTGEVTTVRKSISVSTRGSDEFFMTYVKFMSGYFELKNAIDLKLLLKFCQMAEFNTGKVLLPAGMRKELLEKFGIQNSHLSNSIARLKKVGVLSGEQGNYQLNPIMVWKGDIKTRDEIIKNKSLDFTIKFTGNG